ncbi:unnamed protein product [Linum tenue]|uniref:Hexosyltransferase n=1 Tax=Linum tenue TaxID=586396 RepID=A0AAV0I8Y6_9ROSI|nr:unnamed protein product [Linum tenue]
MKLVTKAPYSRHGQHHRRFILSSIAFILFFCLLASINEVQFDHLLNLGHCNGSIISTTTTTNAAITNSSSSSSNATNTVAVAADDEIRILIGILTLPDQYPRRHFLRMVYGTQPAPKGAKIDVKFVFCNLTKEDQTILVALEIMRFDDIIILNCKENMNNGKTFTYFSTLPDIFSDNGNNNSSQLEAKPWPPYHYVMKGDDDSYFRLGNLVSSLRPLPRDDLYYGYVIPCPSMDPFVEYMSGMGYLVSWDIVEWIKESEIPRNHLDGPEDKVFGSWLKEGRRGRNRHNAKWSMYNFPVPPSGCTHEFWPDTIAVHLLKNQPKWIETLKYFNATKDLKPSKLYHIP